MSAVADPESRHPDGCLPLAGASAAVAADRNADRFCGRRLVLLLALFFCSGACALTYQVLWLRLLALVFGVTVHAASTVLTAFMTGLAVGSVLAGPLLRRVGRPLLIFGVAEILVGLFAAATPFELDAAAFIYERLYRAAPDSLGVLTLARFVSSFVVLLLPTVLMGLTLPALSASTMVRERRFGSRLGALYAINTAGAVTGAVLTGFVLIGGIGIRKSFLLAASVNVAVGVVALLMRRRDTGPDVAPRTNQEPRPAETTPPSLAGVVAIVIVISGLAALALEVIWFRMLAQFLDATTYAFTTMLATVLAGIAAGGGLASRLLRRDRDWTLWLCALQLGTGVAVIASAAFLSWSYAAGWRTSAPVAASAAAILPAALMMGLSFPTALRAAIGAAAVSDGAATGRRVGRLYALNVGGAVVGAVLGGFVLLPWLGTRHALIAAASLYVGSGCLLGLRARSRRQIVLVASLGAITFAFVAARVPDPFAAAFERRHGAGMSELWRYDGLQTAVSVRASQARRVLYLDGVHQADDGPEMVRLHRTIGHLPMVLHASPADALVVGLGGGATAGAVSRYPGVRVQVVELSEGVRRAGPFFAHVSYDVLRSPNVRLRVDDGRNFLLLSGEKFDVITADIIKPHHAGAGHLYSREYFRLVRGALKENGIALQWIGDRSGMQYRLIMRTFLDVFPEATLWCDGSLMTGSLGPLRIHPSTLPTRRAAPETRAALDEVGLADFATLTSWHTAGAREMKRFVGDGPILTDDRPLVEYFRSLPRRVPPLDVSALRGDVTPLIAP
jgi:spermidine synthase